MASRYSKKHLFWLLPLAAMLLLAAALAVGLSMARQHGWRWQGLAWDEGPVLGRLAWQEGNCLRLVVRDMRLRGVWPPRLSAASVTVPPCGDEGETDNAGIALPWAPPFDVAVQALRIHGYPAVQVAVHHRGSRWRAQASLQGGDLQAAYDAADGRWQLTARVVVARLHDVYSGIVDVQGSGYWRPRAAEPVKRFGGRLRLTGKQLGLQRRGPHGALTATARWHGRDWTLDAALKQAVKLGRGWVVQPGEGLHASGTGLIIRQAHAELTARGPQGQTRLSLHSDAARLGSGRGSIVLSRGAAGRIDLSWADGRLTLQPCSISGPKGVTLILNDAVTMPLALEGRIAPSVTVRYDGAEIGTTKSRLSWRGTDVRWRGTVALDGRWHGYRLSGGWSGVIDRDGLHGAPLVATLDAADLHVRARLPVAGLWPLAWPVAVRLDGRFMGQDFAATVSATHADAGWHGELRAGSRLPWAEQGGGIALHGRWLWQDGPVLAQGAHLSVARALNNNVLIRPVELTAVTPLAFGAGGVSGRLRLEAAGLTAARWAVPPLHADLAFDDGHVRADIRIPEWQGVLTVVGQDLTATAAGTFDARLPLQPAISRAFGFIARDGVLTANGHWRAGRQPRISGRLQARGVRLDWGSITAEGLAADLDVRWRPGGVHIGSREPLTVAKLNAGVPVTAISLSLNSDLQTWRLHDIEALLLGGTLSAQALTWPSPDYQPVVLSGIDVAQLAALQATHVVSVSGQVGGTIPLRLGRDTVAIRNGRLQNETPLSLSIRGTAGVRALKQSNRAVGVALDALSPLRIEDFRARIDMSADGWLKAAMTIKGVNPRRELPIVLNYTHRENMYELLRSLRIGSRVVDAIMNNRAEVTPPAAE